MKKKFRVEKDIYSREALLEAIKDFSDACPIHLWEDYSLEFEWENEEEVNILFQEFMNYVISL